MRDENVRAREKFELSLDGRQIASIVVGALVILGVVFVLGLNVGRQIAARQAEVARAGDLDALDRPPAAVPAVDGASLTFHDRLTKNAPAPTPALAAAAEPVRTATLAAAAEAAPSPAPTATAAATAAAPAPTATPPSRKSAAAASTAPASAPDSVRGGAGSAVFTIQVGAAQDRSEAERLASRFRQFRPRVEPAEVDGKGRWYRVRVGSFASREEAERTRKDVARATGVAGYVTAGR